MITQTQRSLASGMASLSRDRFLYLETTMSVQKPLYDQRRLFSMRIKHGRKPVKPITFPVFYEYFKAPNGGLANAKRGTTLKLAYSSPSSPCARARFNESLTPRRNGYVLNKRCIY